MRTNVLATLLVLVSGCITVHVDSGLTAAQPVASVAKSAPWTHGPAKDWVATSELVWCETATERADGSIHCTDWDTDYSRGQWVIGATGIADSNGYLVCPFGSVLVDPQEDRAARGDSVFCVEVR